MAKRCAFRACQPGSKQRVHGRVGIITNPIPMPVEDALCKGKEWARTSLPMDDENGLIRFFSIHKAYQEESISLVELCQGLCDSQRDRLPHRSGCQRVLRHLASRSLGYSASHTSVLRCPIPPHSLEGLAAHCERPSKLDFNNHQ
jgi:hypothetical protein